MQAYLDLHLRVRGLPDEGDAPEWQCDVLCSTISVMVEDWAETQHINYLELISRDMNTLSNTVVGKGGFSHMFMHTCSHTCTCTCLAHMHACARAHTHTHTLIQSIVIINHQCRGMAYLISSNSPSGGMKLMLLSDSNLLSLTHWWKVQSSMATLFFSLFPDLKDNHAKNYNKHQDEHSQSLPALALT